MSEAGRIRARVFLVGCARSGTTLLQSLLAGHPQVASYPESHFFPSTIHTSRWCRKLRLASPSAAPRFRAFLREAGLDRRGYTAPRGALLVPRYVRALLRTLDRASLETGRPVWLEKTPQHLHYVDEIERLVPGARFVHLVRNGADVVASLYEVTHAHPERWGGESDVDTCVERWLGDVAITRRHLGRPGHTVVRYESLVRDPASVLRGLCDFLGLAWDPAALERRREAAGALVLEWESWKAGAAEEIRAGGSGKFERLFGEERRRAILERLAAVDLDELSPLAAPPGSS